jgi:uncharacterized protein YeaO (DUF488 family)
VPRDEYASRDIYDVWLPNLAPSEPLLKQALPVTDERGWRAFERRFRSEMKQPEAKRVLDLLAALSRSADFSIGCYCPDENRCHRSILRTLLEERDAVVR